MRQSILPRPRSGGKHKETKAEQDGGIRKKQVQTTQATYHVAKPVLNISRPSIVSVNNIKTSMKLLYETFAGVPFGWPSSCHRNSSRRVVATQVKKPRGGSLRNFFGPRSVLFLSTLSRDIRPLIMCSSRLGLRLRKGEMKESAA